MHIESFLSYKYESQDGEKFSEYGTYYVNAKDYNGQEITCERINMYEKSQRGDIGNISCDSRILKNIHDICFNLNKVEVVIVVCVVLVESIIARAYLVLVY